MTRAIQRWRVPLGFLGAVALIVLARPRAATLAVGLPVAAAGLALRAAAAGHIRKNDVLATTGPYRWCRNPLYLGSSLLGAGLVIAAASWWLALLALVFLLGIYLPVIRREEAFLAQRFGDDFHRYRTAVPRLLPRWPATRAPQAPAGFSLALYLRHREYQALMGFLALALVLVAKWQFPGLATRLRPW